MIRKQEAPSPLAKDLKAAFADVYSQLGILTGAFAVFSSVARVLKLPLADVFELLVTTFRELFHPIVHFLFGWLFITITPELADLMVLWLAVGGASTRTLWAIGRALSSSTALRMEDRHMQRPFKSTALRFVLMPLAWLLWPAALVVMFARPILATDGSPEALMKSNLRKSNSGGYDNLVVLEESSYRETAIRRQHYRLDLRLVFLLQLAAVLVCVCALTGANALMNAG